MMGFSDIIGQELITGTMKRMAVTGHVPHALIIDGEKGMGKETVAGIFAAALLCEDLKDGEPCGSCHSCLMAASGSHPDIFTVTHEKPGSIGVGEIRLQVVEDVAVKPYYGGRKVYLIPDACLMTGEAQNALLKTLEEPPEYAVIILLTDNKELLLPTLLSRSVSLSMRPVPDDALEAFISKRTEGMLPDTAPVVSFARGNPGKALLLSGSGDFGEFYASMTGFLTSVRDMGVSEISKDAGEAAKNKEDRGDRLDFLLLWFRDILFLKAGGDSDRLIFPEEERAIREASEYYSFERLNDIIEGIKEASSMMDSNVNPEYTFEMLFMKMR